MTTTAHADTAINADQEAAGYSRLSPAHPGVPPSERRAIGKAERQRLPLDAHAQVARDPSREDPVTILEDQARGRVPELLPIRYGRMLVSPFTFFRGAAAVMASDLAAIPNSGLTVQLCGDAHLSNFGLFGSPERRMVFDTNDFDETLPGPFEWDLKRLAASIAVACRDSGFSRKQRRTILGAVGARYRAAMAGFADLRDMELYYLRADVEDVQRRLGSLLDTRRQKMLNKVFSQARARDSMQALNKMTAAVDGRRRIVADPPLVVPVHDLFPDLDAQQGFEHWAAEMLGRYRRTLQSDRRVLLERYRFVDLARKVVGVGSVGTRCWVALFLGHDDDDPVFLQIKEAGPSVLSAYLGRSEYDNQGERVIAGQRLMQQSSDIFLGWLRVVGYDGVERDFYFRQLRDWKGSLEVDALLPKGMQLYAELCAWNLARAHACSGDRFAISGYLGSSDTFDRALTDFAEAYADVTERDHKALTDAITSGRVTAQTGI